MQHPKLIYGTYCILALITFFVYWPSLLYPFQFDDLPNILEYAQLKTLKLSTLLFSTSRWLCTALNCCLYHFFNNQVWAWRSLNLMIHLLNGLLLFNFVLKINKYHLLLPTISTIFFLLHPVQTQTVSYIIQGQLEGLSSLFILLTIHNFANYITTKQSTLKIISLFLIFSSLILATSTKEIAIITPFLILLYDLFYLTAANTFKNKLAIIKTRAWLYLLIFSVTFGSYLYYLKPAFFLKIITGSQKILFCDGNLPLVTTQNTITQYQYLISQFKVICHYLFIFIWPFKLCVEYDFEICEHFWQINCLMPFLILTILFFLIYQIFKKNHWHPMIFGTLWFLICILPRTSLIASNELMLDYKTYLASFGILFILANLIELFINKISTAKNFTKHYLLFLTILTSVLGYLSYNRNLVWRSNLDFWHDVITKAPQKARGFNNYGQALLKAQKPKDAIFYFEHAIALSNHSHPNLYIDPYQNLANAYAMTNQIPLAISTLEKAILVNPNISALHNNLGALFLAQQDYQNSLKHLEIALKLNPQNGQTLYTLGKLYLAFNQIETAWNYLDLACQTTHMDRIGTFLELHAQTSIKLGKFNHAIWSLKKIVRLDQNNITAWLNLAGAYYFNQDQPAALACYEQILKINPNHTVAQNKKLRLKKELAQF